MAKRTFITEKTFHAVKIMTAGGASSAEIAEYLGIGRATVDRIRRWDTFEEYRQQQAAIALDYKKRKELEKAQAKPEEKPEEKPVTQPAVTNFIPYKTQAEIIALLKEQNEFLKLISAKMAFIVEQLA